MRLAQTFKFFRRWGLVAMLVLVPGLLVNSVAQAGQAQGSRASSGQAKIPAARPPEHRIQTAMPDPHSGRVNNARVVLVFPPCGYGNYYDSGQHCYGDHEQNNATVGNHLYK